MNYAKTIISGNLFEAPAIKRFADSDTCIIEMRIGVTETWLNTDGSQGKHIESYRVVKRNASQKFAAWVEQNLHKGTNVFVEGQNRTRSYRVQGAQKDSYITEVIVHRLEKLGDSKRHVAENSADYRQQPAPAQPAAPAQRPAPAQAQARPAPQQAPQAAAPHPSAQNQPQGGWDNANAFDEFPDYPMD